MNWKKLFKSSYDTAETYAEAEKLVKTLFKEELEEFINAHETVAELTGLDMRQEFYLGIAKAIKRYKFEKEVFASEKD